jgi:uncharacterized protein YutE (UPF0331/DUF86 family)
MKLNVSNIKQRLLRLGPYISELEKQRSATLQTFQNDLPRQRAVGRAFQAAIECCTDIAAHIASIYQLDSPQEGRDVYRFLVEAGYIDTAFGESLMAMVGFRNRNRSIMEIRGAHDTLRSCDGCGFRATIQRNVIFSSNSSAVSSRALTMCNPASSTRCWFVWLSKVLQYIGAPRKSSA